MGGRHRTFIKVPRRSALTLLRSSFNLTPRDIDGWNDLTRRMRPPARALDRFTELHPEVRADQVPLVWEAFLQWIRIRGRHPSTVLGPLAMYQPSLAVDEMWQQLANDMPTWRHLPEQVQAMDRIPARDQHSGCDLAHTHQQAHWDEFSTRLPLLFLVDEAVGITDGRRYRLECIVEDCKARSRQGDPPEQGRTCLHGIPWAATGSVGGAAP